MAGKRVSGRRTLPFGRCAPPTRKSSPAIILKQGREREKINASIEVVASGTHEVEGGRRG